MPSIIINIQETEKLIPKLKEFSHLNVKTAELSKTYLEKQKLHNIPAGYYFIIEEIVEV